MIKPIEVYAATGYLIHGTLGMGPRKRFQFDRDLYIKVGSFNFSVHKSFDSLGSVAFLSIVASLSSAETAIMTAAQ